jgi:gluconolactonase
MFTSPTVLQTSVWARLPDHFRRQVAQEPWKAYRFPNRPDCFLEGPAFDRLGNLYVTDIPHGRIFKVTPGAEFSLVAEYDGEPNGLAIHRNGTIFIADYRNGILTLDPATGAITPFVRDLNGVPLKGPNDLTFSHSGDLYFTDQGQSGLSDATGRLVRVRNNGKIDVLLDCIPSPNGLVLNRSESTLFLAVTRQNAIWRVPLPEYGACPTRVGVAIQLSGGNGPDGLAMDENDTLFIAHNKLGCIWGFDRRGEPVYRINSCTGDDTTNIAFGGTDRKAAFITESETGTILKVNLNIAGTKLFSEN